MTCVPTQTNEVVSDEAVENGAEHVLRVGGQNGSEAEQRACVVAARAGMTAAMRVSRLVALAISRYARRAPRHTQRDAAFVDELMRRQSVKAARNG